MLILPNYFFCSSLSCLLRSQTWRGSLGTHHRDENSNLFFFLCVSGVVFCLLVYSLWAFHVELQLDWDTRPHMKLAHYVNPPPRLLRFDLFSVLFWSLSDKTWHGSGFSLLLRGKKNSLNMKHWNICWTINWRVLHCGISILCRKGAADPHQKQVLGRSWSSFQQRSRQFSQLCFIYGVNLQAQQSQPHLQLRGRTAKPSTH